jgi:hypothetical protein
MSGSPKRAANREVSLLAKMEENYTESTTELPLN